MRFLFNSRQIRRILLFENIGSKMQGTVRKMWEIGLHSRLNTRHFFSDAGCHITIIYKLTLQLNEKKWDLNLLGLSS